MSKKAFYPVQVFWSDEDDGYIALVPDLPGCSAFGGTAEEALRESNDAIAAWLQAAEAARNPVPKPSQPPLHKKYSGKILIRIPQTLHGQLADGAGSEGVSLNQYIVFLLTEGHTRRSVPVSYSNVVSSPNFYTQSTCQIAQVHPISGVEIASSVGSSTVSQMQPLTSSPLLSGWWGSSALMTTCESQRRSAAHG